MIPKSRGLPVKPNSRALQLRKGQVGTKKKNSSNGINER
jgi:hypothetical protein